MIQFSCRWPSLLRAHIHATHGNHQEPKLPQPLPFPSGLHIHHTRTISEQTQNNLPSLQSRGWIRLSVLWHHPWKYHGGEGFFHGWCHSRAVWHHDGFLVVAIRQRWQFRIWRFCIHMGSYWWVIYSLEFKKLRTISSKYLMMTAFVLPLSISSTTLHEIIRE